MGPRSLHWRSLLEHSFVGLVGLVMTLLGGGKDGSNTALEHGSEACGRVVVGLVVRVAAADSGIGTPGSTPLLSVGESVSGQSSLSLRASVPMTDRSKFVRGPPSPEHGLEENECDYSWWEGQPCESCFGVWLRGEGRNSLELLSRKVGSRTEPFSK